MTKKQSSNVTQHVFSCYPAVQEPSRARIIIVPVPPYRARTVHEPAQVAEPEVAGTVSTERIDQEAIRIRAVDLRNGGQAIQVCIRPIVHLRQPHIEVQRVVRRLSIGNLLRAIPPDHCGRT